MDDEDAKHETRAFGFFEVLRMKYLCCDRKQAPRYKRFRELMKIVAERMDICQIVTNSGNINMLSHVLLQPYQKKIISLEKISGSGDLEKASSLSIADSIKDLKSNIQAKRGDKITQNIDSFLFKMIGEDEKSHAEVNNVKPA